MKLRNIHNLKSIVDSLEKVQDKNANVKITVYRLPKEAREGISVHFDDENFMSTSPELAKNIYIDVIEVEE